MKLLIANNTDNLHRKQTREQLKFIGACFGIAALFAGLIWLIIY